MTPYPLFFEPILKPKVWGGRALERLHKALPAGENIGESWEIADLGATSPDAGGGDAARSVIAHGPMRGLTIGQAITAMGGNLMGRAALSKDGGFPLLVKYLDARENLSVQVHPSPAYAAAHPEAHLKTESWYIVHAETGGPGAVIYRGIKPGVTPGAFEKHIADGSVVNDMIAVPVKAGDFFHLPSGVCHALGGGVVVAEVQTPSDTTYRVFDWGRKGRALHVEQAMQCIHFGPPERVDALNAGGAHRTTLVSTEFYSLVEWNLAANEPHVVRIGGGAPRIWMVLGGSGRLAPERGEYEAVRVRAGDTILLPAALSASNLVPDSPIKLLEVVLPHP